MYLPVQSSVIAPLISSSENGFSADNLSSEQQQQLLTLYNQHVLQVGRQHGGVRSIDFSHAEPDTALNIMQVFLKMTYTDNTQEEIVVPMVQADGEWKMK